MITDDCKGCRHDGTWVCETCPVNETNAGWYNVAEAVWYAGLLLHNFDFKA